MFENDECMTDMLKFMDFIHKREDVKPILKQIDDAFENSESDEEAFNKIDEIIFKYFDVKLEKNVRDFYDEDLFIYLGSKLKEDKREELGYFCIYIESSYSEQMYKKRILARNRS
jgi:hypothetical protein